MSKTLTRILLILSLIFSLNTKLTGDLKENESTQYSNKDKLEPVNIPELIFLEKLDFIT